MKAADHGCLWIVRPFLESVIGFQDFIGGAFARTEQSVFRMVQQINVADGSHGRIVPMYCSRLHNLTALPVRNDSAIARLKLSKVPISTYSASCCFLASSKRRIYFAATKKPIPAD
jgi:hypothetical protein